MKFSVQMFGDEWSLTGAIEIHCRIGGWYCRHDFIL